MSQEAGDFHALISIARKKLFIRFLVQSPSAAKQEAVQCNCNVMTSVLDLHFFIFDDTTHLLSKRTRVSQSSRVPETIKKSWLIHSSSHAIIGENCHLSMNYPHDHRVRKSPKMSHTVAEKIEGLSSLLCSIVKGHALGKIFTLLTDATFR